LVPAAVAGVALLSAGLVQSGAAEASWGWCADDPIVLVNGAPLQTTVGVYADSTTVSRQVRGATVTYTVPASVSISLKMANNVYWPENVVLAHSNAAWSPGQPVSVSVSVTFDSAASLPAQLLNVSGGTVYPAVDGTTAAMISTSFSVAGNMPTGAVSSAFAAR